MSTTGLIRRGFVDRIARARRILARATAWPLTVRLSVFAAALAAQGFAYPPDALLGGQLFAIVLLAALPALWPRTAAVSTYWLLTVVGWVLSTMFYGSVATLPRLIGLSLMLYVVHTGAALAAVMPYDAIVSAAVVARWMLRAGTVAVVAIGLSVAGLYSVNSLSENTYLAATLIGLIPVVALVWLLAVVSRRR